MKLNNEIITRFNYHLNNFQRDRARTGYYDGEKQFYEDVIKAILHLNERLEFYTSVCHPEKEKVKNES